MICAISCRHCALRKANKLDVGKLELERISVNVRELVDAVAQLMRRSAEAQGLRLSVDIDADMRLAVRGDPVRLTWTARTRSG